MKATLCFTAFLVTALVSCNRNTTFEQRTLKAENPTSMVFEIPADSLRSAIIGMFKDLKYMNSTFYNNSVFNVKNDAGLSMPVGFIAESSENAVFAKKYFQAAQNRDEIYLYNNGFTWPSPVYVADGESLPFRASYIVRLTALDSAQTRLSVEAENPVVVSGVECCGPHGSQGKENPVAATTIEEYTIILFIAEQLGVTAPPLRLELNDEK